MTLQPGSRLGAYEIVEAIGAGGMGEVYRARDTRLDRMVAVKVLPASFRDDPALKSRFRREARLISSIADPNICALYDVGDQDGIDYLVMEFVEGQTLAARLTKGALRRDEALRHASEIASALASAHRHGVVHRDLKPANVMLTRTGAKLLDFGLAKLSTTEVVSFEAAGSTLTKEQSGMTAAGTIVGTLNYMSPEQLEGRDADGRSDIFAFGSVLYEMVSGRRAFDGESPASVIGAILHREPAPIGELADPSDRPLSRIIRRCLAKNPDERWQTAYDLARELEWIAEAPEAVRGARPPRGRRLIWIAAGVAIAAAAVAMAFLALRPRTSAIDPVQFVVLPPDGAAFGSGSQDRVPSFAVAPDGRALAFVATDASGRRELWMRWFRSTSAQKLPDTDGAQFPFWSPDGRAIAFFAQGKLKKVAIAGGPAMTLTDAADPQGGTWNHEGVILFAPAEGLGLHRVADTGGVATAVTAVEAGVQVRRHSWPQFLPDGRHFIYWARGRPEPGSFYIGTLDGHGGKRLLAGTFMATYAAPGYLLFLRDGALFAQRFDPERQELSGEPLTIAESVAFSSTNARASFAASDNGVLAYRSSGLLAATSLVWTDRSGKTIGSAGPPGDYQTTTLSPDESRLVAEMHDLRTGVGDLWLIDLNRGSTSRVTFDGMHHQAAVWAPDGSRFVFGALHDGVRNVHLKMWNSSEPDEPLLPIGGARLPTDWSPDARYIFFDQSNPKTHTDLFVLQMPERKSSPYLVTEFNERDARVSPDGRWVAYVSNESGRDEVYVRSFPVSNSRWPVSVAGGMAPRWRRDGRELFYLAAGNIVTAVPVRISPQFEPGLPQPLFKAAIRNNRDYSVSADGKRFLLNPSPVGSIAVLPINIVVNWPALLTK
jgi:Tol biopolymer transport system component